MEIRDKLLARLHPAIHPLVKLKILIVLMGEATHASYEFYQSRIEITQQLIEKKGFMVVAIEDE